MAFIIDRAGKIVWTGEGGGARSRRPSSSPPSARWCADPFHPGACGYNCLCSPRKGEDPMIDRSDNVQRPQRYGAPCRARASGARRLPPGCGGAHGPPRACARSACRRSAARSATRAERRRSATSTSSSRPSGSRSTSHDEFYQSPPVQRIYGTLQSILTSGPFEVLYDAVVEEPQHDTPPPLGEHGHVALQQRRRDGDAAAAVPTIDVKRAFARSQARRQAHRRAFGARVRARWSPQGRASACRRSSSRRIRRASSATTTSSSSA